MCSSRPSTGAHSCISASKKIKGIKRLQHFTFPADKPGVVLMRQQWDGPTTEMVLLQGQLPHGMPPTILPAGLTRDRQAYLFRHIRQFVDEDKRDIVCPRPAISRSPSPSSQSSSPSSESDSSDVSLSKRARSIGRGVLGRPGRARRGHTNGQGTCYISSTSRRYHNCLYLPPPIHFVMCTCFNV